MPTSFAHALPRAFPRALARAFPRALRQRWLRTCAAIALGTAALAAFATETPTAHWLPTWTASEQPVWQAGELPLPTGVPARLDNQTLRQIARISVGGARARLVLSNRYGREPVTIGAARIALAAGRGGIDARTDRAATFGGSPSITIPAGATVTSDAIELALPPLSELAVSLHLPKPFRPGGFHWDGRQTAWLAPGDATRDATLPDATSFSGRLLLAAIEVEASHGAGAVVAIGDSITEGNGSTVDANRRWPDGLAARLAPQGLAVLNAGISGGQLLRDGMGESALARFERDVLGQTGVRAVIVAIGINDIGWPGSTFAARTPLPDPAAMIEGYRALIRRSHERGIRAIGATITPFAGALAGTPIRGYDAPPRKEALRQAINAWIRDSGEFDAVADFDAALRDPARPEAMLPRYDSGDHLHPGDAGYRRMAEVAAAAVAGVAVGAAVAPSAATD
ncbi:SGNH/GDSL hydrolase family protein [Cupriavidus cauae]|uniref:SGNH/GDSL hydrolase family protein n=1 Tax=Cupriavidus cauae TaxID=2608999 RepID=A0A5M8ADS9_9BURK|nr:SGNH/GDSL hydrolase family protein [Cupriavidus cauae]KAA6120842.1 SGNH/GDSL hydrolase family protein [Cupriavidus cauae]